MSAILSQSESEPSWGIFEFSSMRRDWYVSNDALPKVFRACLEGKRILEFVGFPRQWIPVFEWFGLKWSGSIEPKEYIPFFSDLDEETLLQIIEKARREKALRILVESATMYDAVLSDFLYIVDNTVKTPSMAMENEILEILENDKSSRKRRLLLNGWQSYGRPSIRQLEAEVIRVESKKKMALVLPCAITRPYWKSKTHKKIYEYLEEIGYCPSDFHKIVITSLGILPEEVWEMPQVLAYDAGVPDIYRLLRLTRSFFKNRKYRYVIDCLNFEPYSDILNIVAKEGLIKELYKVNIPGVKPFFIRP